VTVAFVTDRPNLRDVEQPLVSVLTPSFNHRRWLGDNVDCVARQTYPRIEHVVMDGGSTDGSVES
jgi:glycosyltransferase involved in cell wall biosynthesis